MQYYALSLPLSLSILSIFKVSKVSTSNFDLARLVLLTDGDLVHLVCKSDQPSVNNYYMYPVYIPSLSVAIHGHNFQLL